MMTNKEILAVVREAELGKQIQYSGDNKDWIRANNPVWNFHNRYYRVEPEPRECWVNITGYRSIGYESKDLAFENIRPGTKYDGIAIHMREVTEDE